MNGSLKGFLNAHHRTRIEVPLQDTMNVLPWSCLSRGALILIVLDPSPILAEQPPPGGSLSSMTSVCMGRCEALTPAG
ncbi:MAG: hypothetical protein EOM20_07615 [Spartobacteria bacterium]|nr:hypothetical protein [Spartobacteria bacterium]